LEHRHMQMALPPAQSGPDQRRLAIMQLPSAQMRRRTAEIPSPLEVTPLLSGKALLSVLTPRPDFLLLLYSV